MCTDLEIFFDGKLRENRVDPRARGRYHGRRSRSAGSPPIDLPSKVDLT